MERAQPMAEIWRQRAEILADQGQFGQIWEIRQLPQDMRLFPGKAGPAASPAEGSALWSLVQGLSTRAETKSGF